MGSLYPAESSDRQIVRLSSTVFSSVREYFKTNLSSEEPVDSQIDMRSTAMLTTAYLPLVLKEAGGRFRLRKLIRSGVFDNHIISSTAAAGSATVMVGFNPLEIPPPQRRSDCGVAPALDVIRGIPNP
jgi:hypothetical protein